MKILNYLVLLSISCIYANEVNQDNQNDIHTVFYDEKLAGDYSVSLKLVVEQLPDGSRNEAHVYSEIGLQNTVHHEKICKFHFECVSPENVPQNITCIVKGDYLIYNGVWESGYIEELYRIRMSYDGIPLHWPNAARKDLFQAMNGNSEAQYRMACYYLDSLKRPRNIAKGRDWALRAAKQDNVEAMCLLSASYSSYGISNEDRYIIDGYVNDHPIYVTIVPAEERELLTREALRWAFRAKIRGDSTAEEIANINLSGIANYQKIKKEIFEEEQKNGNLWKEHISRIILQNKQ